MIEDSSVKTYGNTKLLEIIMVFYQEKFEYDSDELKMTIILALVLSDDVKKAFPRPRKKACYCN